MTKQPETDYIKLYQELHSKEDDYGTTGNNYFDEVCLVIDYLNPKSVLDYGCGKAVLIKQLQEKYPDIKFYGYDPAIPERAKMPIKKADLVINTDVLEHIPEKQLPDVIKKISELSPRVFFGVHHALAYTLLSNGENAHCTVKPVFWYYHLLEKHFPNLTVLQGRESYLHTILTFPVKPHFIKNYEALMDNKNEKINQNNKALAEIRWNIEKLNTKTVETAKALDGIVEDNKLSKNKIIDEINKTNEQRLKLEQTFNDFVKNVQSVKDDITDKITVLNKKHSDAENEFAKFITSDKQTKDDIINKIAILDKNHTESDKAFAKFIESDKQAKEDIINKIATLDKKRHELEKAFDEFVKYTEQNNKQFINNFIQINERFLNIEKSVQDLIHDSERQQFFRILGIKIKIHKI